MGIRNQMESQVKIMGLRGVQLSSKIRASVHSLARVGWGRWGVQKADVMVLPIYHGHRDQARNRFCTGRLEFASRMCTEGLISKEIAPSLLFIAGKHR